MLLVHLEVIFQINNHNKNLHIVHTKFSLIWNLKCQLPVDFNDTGWFYDMLERVKRQFK